MKYIFTFKCKNCKRKWIVESDASHVFQQKCRAKKCSDRDPITYSEKDINHEA